VFGATHGKEIIMVTNFGHAAVVLALLAGTSSAANAQYYREYDARPILTQPLPLTQAQRTTIYRTIIPQGRGRQPIVRERIVTESVPVAPPAPIVREGVVGGPLDAYAYGDTQAYRDVYAYEPAPRYGYEAPAYQRRYVVEPDAYSANASAYVVGGRVPAATQLAPLPPALIADVPAIRSYRYITVGPRVLLVDPNTGVIVADVTQ
jgi:hypothetical protein